MDLDLALAAGFVVLSQERHYGRAAARLHLTQSALTKRIQRLERQLGVALIERPAHGAVQLTPAGRRFHDAVEPLLAHAAAVRDTARRRPTPYWLRLGHPAGTGASLDRIGLATIAHTVRRSFPEARISCRDVDFTDLNDCLPEHRVDVLWTIAPVRHLAVDSFAADAEAEVVGLVGRDSGLAGVTAVDVAVFCEQPMLFNPAIPDEFMDPFLLTHVRPRHDAHLVAVDARDQGAVLRTAAEGRGVTATLAHEAYGAAGPAPGSRLHAIGLVGASPVRFYAACRRADRRGAVALLVDRLRAVRTDAFR